MTPNVTAVKHRSPVRKRSENSSDKAPESSPKGAVRLTRWVQGAAILTMLGGGVFFLVGPQSWRRNEAPSQGYRLTQTYPHSPDAYCQGLVYHNGFLYEGTGDWGKSTLRKVELETGKVLQQRKLNSRLFGEGIVIWKDKIIQLTWKSGQAFVYDLKTFQPVGRFTYPGEGWGLTHNGQHLIMSNGTANLRFLDPETFRVKRQLTVKDGRVRISNLNELEYVEGEIYANIWYEDRIARISPQTGKVIGWLDLSKLYPKSQRSSHDAVLNGIAYDAQKKRLLVTGKNWPKMFEISLPR